ncbi:MAG: DUF4351 domain-containing protein [Planctomycetaceae bacterium]|nr:DUF4351 domain-containing protein [Planctomycetaceae bacterium]
MPTLLQHCVNRGKIEEKIETILRLLTRRFGQCSGTIEVQLSEITDLERLNQLWDVAYDCRNLEEFSDALESER